MLVCCLMSIIYKKAELAWTSLRVVMGTLTPAVYKLCAKRGALDVACALRRHMYSTSYLQIAASHPFSKTPMTLAAIV